MTLQRTLLSCLALALGCLAADRCLATEFQQRMAAWQAGGAASGAGNGRSPASPSDRARAAMPQPAVPQAAVDSAAPLPAAEPLPAAAPPQRLLAQSWQPQPRYAGYGPVPHGCSTCAPHQPLYDPGYGPVFDSCQSGGGGGCGGCGLFRHCGTLGCGQGGGCGGDACCDAGPGCMNTMVWARFEVLMWWRQGRDFPPLVTTDPVSVDSTEAGILPDAEILFGGELVGSDMQAGGRFDIGWWCDPRQCTGWGWRFWGLGKDATGFNVNSLQNPVLAIPFFNVDDEANDALLLAYPGLRSGSINISGTSEVLGNDVYGRFLLCRDCDSRIDFITGWHYSRMNDGVEIRSESTVTEVGGNIPFGTQTNIIDQFDARNRFHGGILGLEWVRDCGCWTTRALARMSIGNMHEEVIINGRTAFTAPGEDPEVTQGGLFTGESNIGTFERDEFTAITEVGLTLAYRWGPCTQLSVGYTFIYWNDVVTAADHIDTNVGEGSPQFAFQHSDYWVQGINLGLVREF